MSRRGTTGTSTSLAVFPEVGQIARYTKASFYSECHPIGIITLVEQLPGVPHAPVRICIALPTLDGTTVEQAWVLDNPGDFVPATPAELVALATRTTA